MQSNKVPIWGTGDDIRLRIRSCTLKGRFLTKELAEKGITRTPNNDTNRGYLHVYNCEFCLGWHIGHTIARIPSYNMRKRNE